MAVFGIDEEKLKPALERLSKKGHIYLAIILILYSVWSFVEFRYLETGEYHFLNAQIQPMKDQIKEMKEKIAKAREFLANEESVKTRLLEVTKQIEVAQKQLPERFDNTQMIQTINEELQMINFKNGSLKPSTDQDYSFYKGRKYEIESIGSFLQFLVLMERLGKKERIINVTDLNLALEKMDGRFQLLKGKVGFETYKYLTETASIQGEGEGEGEGEGKK